MKIDTNKIAMTACNAFVSAACGALGSYAVHRLVKATEKVTEKMEEKNERKIGFDMRGTAERENG